MKSMNNQTNKELKDYTDQELTNELARRIENFSFDTNFLIHPSLTIAEYNEEKERRKCQENKNSE
jgi:hypothetical protein